MRDQNEQTVAAMDRAFSRLKESLEEAALSANVNIDDLVTFPKEAKEIITMFPSAFLPEEVNGNKDFVLTRCAPAFRRKCSTL